MTDAENSVRFLHDHPKPRVLMLGLLGNDVVEAITELAGHVEHHTTGAKAVCHRTRWAMRDGGVAARTVRRGGRCG